MSRSANNDDVDPYSYIGDEDLANRLRMMDALSEHMSSNSIEGQQPASDGGDDKPYDVWDVKKNWLFWLIYAIITLILVVPFWSLLALAYCDKIPKFVCGVIVDYTHNIQYLFNLISFGDSVSAGP